VTRNRLWRQFFIGMGCLSVNVSPATAQPRVFSVRDQLLHQCERADSDAVMSSDPRLRGTKDQKYTYVLAKQRVLSVCNDVPTNMSNLLAAYDFVEVFNSSVKLVKGSNATLAMEPTIDAERLGALLKGICTDSSLNLKVQARVMGGLLVPITGYVLVKTTTGDRDEYFWREIENGAAVLPPHSRSYDMRIVYCLNGKLVDKPVTIRPEEILKEKQSGQCQRAIDLE
jgi:hypothetical protein